MQALLWERRMGGIRPLEFSTSIVETFYLGLKQNAGHIVFPDNCHKNAAVNSLSLDSSKRYLLSGCADSSIKLWDLFETEDMLKEDNATSNEGTSEICKDGKIHVEVANTNKKLVSNIATIPRKSIHEFGISCIKWWPYDSGMFVSSSFDHSVKIWDTNELEVVHSFDMSNRVYSIDISGEKINDYSSNALVAVASDQPYIRLIDLRSTSSAHTLNGHKGKTLSVKWHPQNSYLLASGGYDGETKIWDIRRSQSCLTRLDMLKTDEAGDYSDNLKKVSVKSHSGPVNGMEWSALGNTLFTVGNDDKIRVWDFTSSGSPPVNRLINFGPLTRNKYPQTIPILLSPPNETELQYLIFPSDNGDIFIFRTIDGKMVSRLVRSGKNSGRTSSMEYLGNYSGTYLCGTMDGEIITWNFHQ